MRRRLLFLLAAPVLALAAIFPASPALANTGGGPWNFSEASGSWWAGASNLNAGTAVWEADGPRDMFWAPTGGTYNGDDTGYLEFSNGNPMRTSDSCASVYITSTSADNGTVWALHYANGHVYVINRRCDQQIGSGNGGVNGVALAGKNVQHRQFFVSQPATGVYRAFSMVTG